MSCQPHHPADAPLAKAPANHDPPARQPPRSGL